MICQDLELERTGAVPIVTELRGQFPHLPPKVWITLAVLALLSRNCSPFRRCGCGCGAFVRGKAVLASPACRKRAQRARDAAAGPTAKQFNLVLQDELPVPIPFSRAPRDQGSEISAQPVHLCPLPEKIIPASMGSAKLKKLTT